MGNEFEFSITEVANILNIEVLKDSESRSLCVCPFCGKKYKLYLYKASNTFKCHKCGDKKGGMLNLYSEVRGCDTVTAYREIRQHLGIISNNGIDVNKVRERKQQFAKSRKRLQKSEKERIPTQSPTKRDKVYRTILTIPELELSDMHYDNLNKRGMSDELAGFLEYRSIDNLSWVKEKPLLSKDEFYAIRKKHESYKTMRYEETAAGIYVATFLLARGYKLSGLTGFFKFGEYWCFVLYRNSMLIPTRNSKGLIVGFQYRMDTGDVRYLTLSSGKYPNGCINDLMFHFPLNNADISKTDTLYLTEGPMKADIATSYLKKPFLAMLGVNNIQNLKGIFEMLKENGITKVVNAYDMDRLLNSNVKSALNNVTNIVRSLDLKFEHLYWDEVFAKEKLEQLISIANENKLKEKYSGDISKLNVYQKLSFVARLLATNGVKFDTNWNEKTKGIDDFLLYSHSVKKH